MTYHKPGVIASEADRAPEFHAQTIPAGSAPSSQSFQPNPALEAMGGYNASTTANDTIGGATSGELHTGLGHPGQGMTSSEVHHDGAHGRVRQPHGLAGVGAQVGNDSKVVDAHDPVFAHQRALDRDEARLRGTVGGPPAEERFPEPAERVAAEAPRK